MVKNNIVLTNHLFWLIANYESDEPYEEGEEPCLSFSLKELHDWKELDHHGDCVNMPMTCMRCFAERCWHKACWIVDNLPYNQGNGSRNIEYGSEQEKR